MLGIELDENDPTAQDGSVGNKSYFKTSMGRGIFVRRASVVSFDKSSALIAKETNMSESDEEQQSDQSEEEDLEVGNCIELESGITGIIKLIGLEMETWNSDGHDGSKNNKRYFQCKLGHGMW